MTVVVNGKPCELAEGTTVADLLTRLELAARPVAVEVNRQVSCRESFPAHVLRPGDAVEIVTLVGGG
jgi:sulfur carrier protein